MPLVGLYPISLEHANDLLDDWQHKLGRVNRPFRSEAFVLEVDQRAVAVAVSASIVSSTVAGYGRQQVVELARLGSSETWVNRIMLRLWREQCAPRWHSWPVQAAISYSHNAMHRGDLYRFDGWERIRDDCGSSGGGAWTRPRYATDAVHGRKTLWLWRYDR
jgi:hypothetical protein